MRIIGGNFKNKKLYFPKNLSTRPLKDNVKENIFNILSHSNLIDFKFKNSSILDLYSGSGSFGLECISRGASNIFFVENDSIALKFLKKNIFNLNSRNKINVKEKSIFKFFDNLHFEIYKKKFDLVFMDPPYNDKGFLDIIKIIKKKDILNKKHILIIHREINSQDNLEKLINVFENRTYGRSEIFFCNLF